MDEKWSITHYLCVKMLLDTACRKNPKIYFFWQKFITIKPKVRIDYVTKNLPVTPVDGNRVLPDSLKSVLGRLLVIFPP
jgi:hypothetical protein